MQSPKQQTCGGAQAFAGPVALFSQLVPPPAINGQHVPGQGGGGVGDVGGQGPHICAKQQPPAAQSVSVIQDPGDEGVGVGQRPHTEATQQLPSAQLALVTQVAGDGDVEGVGVGEGGQGGIMQVVPLQHTCPPEHILPGVPQGVGEDVGDGEGEEQHLP